MSTKDRLLNTALELFATHGYDGVGVKEIVDRTGVTKPTLYHHFGNKEGVLVALFSRVEPFMDELRTVSAYSGDLYMSLKNALNAYVLFARENPALFRMFRFMSHMPESTVSAQTVLPYVRRSQAVFEALFASASLDHGNMQGKANMLAFNFRSLCVTCASRVAEEQMLYNEGVSHNIIHAFSHGIYS